MILGFDKLPFFSDFVVQLGEGSMSTFAHFSFLYLSIHISEF